MSHLILPLLLAAPPTLDPSPDAVIIRGIAEGQLRVYVLPEGVDEIGDRPPILGKVMPLDSGLRFVPRFGFEPGVRYRVTVTVPDSDSPITRDFTLTRDKPAEPTRLTTVHPSGETIPANLLKIYLHFSAPMAQGDSYRYIRLLDPDGKVVEIPFLELPEELWDETGKRLTLYIDPGRIKREVKPREDLGPVFVPGGNYTLEINGKWKDATGTPLGETFRKKFTATEPLRDAHDPEDWKLTSPEAGTRLSLNVRFPRPLDHALAQRMIRVLSPEGGPLAGKITLSDAETGWEFVPTQPWKPGRHQLKINTALEDLAGNRIDAPFEVDVFDKVEKTVTSKFVERPFRVK